MQKILTAIEEGEKSLDEYTIAKPWELNTDYFYIDATNEDIKQHITTTLISVLQAQVEGWEEDKVKFKWIIDVSEQTLKTFKDPVYFCSVCNDLRNNPESAHICEVYNKVHQQNITTAEAIISKLKNE